MKLIKKLIIPLILAGIAFFFFPQIKTWVINTWNWLKTTKIYKTIAGQFDKAGS